MTPRLKALVRRRAQHRCEYCRFPENLAELGFQTDHVVPQKHGGRGNPENLAFACFRCNSHKGPNLSGIDPRSGKVNRLYNPRTDVWSDHFQWAGAKLLGKTSIGRTTITVLCINRADAIQVRLMLAAEGVVF